MKQNTETKMAHHPINMWPFTAVFVICAVIQFDALAAIIPNQMAALGPPLSFGELGRSLYLQKQKEKISIICFTTVSRFQAEIG